LVSFTFDFPDDSNDLQCCVEFDFSDTTLRAFAYPLSKPENRKEVVIGYEF